MGMESPTPEPVLCFENAETFLASIGMPVSAFELHPIILIPLLVEGGSDHGSNYRIRDLNYGGSISESVRCGGFPLEDFIPALKNLAAKVGYDYIVSIKFIMNINSRLNVSATGLKRKPQTP